MKMHETIKGLTADDHAAALLAIRVTKLLTGLANKPEWNSDYRVIEGHDIANDYMEVCNISAREIATNDRAARDLVTTTAERWGVNITINGIDE